jgi:hypothetical protein
MRGDLNSVRHRQTKISLNLGRIHDMENHGLRPLTGIALSMPQPHGQRHRRKRRNVKKQRRDEAHLPLPAHEREVQA